VVIAPATCEPGVELGRGDFDRFELTARVVARDITVVFSGLWVLDVAPLFPHVDMGTSAKRMIAWEEERLGRELAPGSVLYFVEGAAPGDRGRGE
jgi:hypothetical protein